MHCRHFPQTSSIFFFLSLWMVPFGWKVFMFVFLIGSCLAIISLRLLSIGSKAFLGLPYIYIYFFFLNFLCHLHLTNLGMHVQGRLSEPITATIHTTEVFWNQLQWPAPIRPLIEYYEKSTCWKNISLWLQFGIIHGCRHLSVWGLSYL